MEGSREQCGGLEGDKGTCGGMNERTRGEREGCARLLPEALEGRQQPPPEKQNDCAPRMPSLNAVPGCFLQGQGSGQGIIQGQAKLVSRMGFQPVSLKSKSHLQLKAHVERKHKGNDRLVQRVATVTNPERELEERGKAIEMRNKGREVLKTKQDRYRRRKEARPITFPAQFLLGAFPCKERVALLYLCLCSPFPPLSPPPSPECLSLPLPLPSEVLCPKATPARFSPGYPLRPALALRAPGGPGRSGGFRRVPGLKVATFSYNRSMRKHAGFSSSMPMRLNRDYLEADDDDDDDDGGRYNEVRRPTL